MSKSITTEPYEFLVRFKDGKLAGAHVQFIDYVYENEVFLYHKIQDPQPVEEGGKFPFKGMIEKVNVAALARVAVLEEELKAALDQLKRTA